MAADAETERAVAHVAAQAGPEFDPLALQCIDMALVAGEGGADPEAPDENLVQQAREIILRDRRASTSYLQRALRLGYHRAATLIDILQQRGVLGPQVGSAPRAILTDAAPSAPEADPSR